jgi:hypothetical protein
MLLCLTHTMKTHQKNIVLLGVETGSGVEYLLKTIFVLFTLSTFLDTQKYSLHFECLAGQENGPIHSFIKKTSLVIPTASDLADSLNTRASFVKDV